MNKKRIIFLVILLTTALACNLPATPAPQLDAVPTIAPTNAPPEPDTAPSPTAITIADLPTPTLVEPTASPIDTLPSGPVAGTFTLAILVDMDDEPVTYEQAQSLVDQASQILYGLTQFELVMVDFREVYGAINMDQITQDYLADPSAILADGIIIFSYGDNDTAKTFGGYAYAIPGPAGYQNRFVSPNESPNSIYISIIQFGHRFAACGYGSDSDTPISDTSIDGECFNQQGTSCVQNNGYQMCSNALEELYASTPTYFSSATFIHEIMHSFGALGNQDHYGTEECGTAMLTNDRPYNTTNVFDNYEADYYTNMCPYVFDAFIDSYQP